MRTVWACLAVLALGGCGGVAETSDAGEDGASTALHDAAPDVRAPAPDVIGTDTSAPGADVSAADDAPVARDAAMPDDAPVARDAAVPHDASAPTDSGATTALQVGLNSGGSPSDYSAASILHEPIVRFEAEIGATPASFASAIAAYADRGVEVELMASFYGAIPTLAQAQNLATWAAAYGPGGTFWASRTDGHLAVRFIEFGNETSYGYQYGDGYTDASYRARAQTYAQRVRDAQMAIGAVNPGVSVLCQAEDGGSGSSVWVDNMFTAVPDLASRVGGWVIHPYGPNGPPKMTRMLANLASHGAPTTVPIAVTEWGITSDNGVCLPQSGAFDPCITYANAATQMHASIAGYITMLGARLRLFMIYQVSDQAPPGTDTDSEHYYGVLRHDLSTKGPYTTEAEAQFAAHP